MLKMLNTLYNQSGKLSILPTLRPAIKELEVLYFPLAQFNNTFAIKVLVSLRTLIVIR